MIFSDYRRPDFNHVSTQPSQMRTFKFNRILIYSKTLRVETNLYCFYCFVWRLSLWLPRPLTRVIVKIICEHSLNDLQVLCLTENLFVSKHWSQTMSLLCDNFGEQSLQCSRSRNEELKGRKTKKSDCSTRLNRTTGLVQNLTESNSYRLEFSERASAHSVTRPFVKRSCQAFPAFLPRSCRLIAALLEWLHRTLVSESYINLCESAWCAFALYLCRLGVICRIIIRNSRYKFQIKLSSWFLACQPDAASLAIIHLTCPIPDCGDCNIIIIIINKSRRVSAWPRSFCVMMHFPIEKFNKKSI